MGLLPSGFGAKFWILIGATFLGFLGIGAVLKSQNTVVSITDHDNFSGGPMLPPVLYPKIENIEQVNVREQRRNHLALRSPHFRLRPFPILGYCSPQPRLDQPENPSISDAVLEKLDHPSVRNRIKKVTNVGVQHPAHFLSHDSNP